MTIPTCELDRYWEAAIRDDACDRLVPSDIRALVRECQRLRKLLDERDEPPKKIENPHRDASPAEIGVATLMLWPLWPFAAMMAASRFVPPGIVETQTNAILRATRRKKSADYE